MKNVLQDKVAVITGGSRGLGFAIAETYARAGAKVVIASRSPHSVDQAVDSLRASGYQATGLACDVANITHVEALASHAIQTFGQIDIWVNNAGLSAPYGPTIHIPTKEMMDVINTNITGTYNGSVIAMREFLKTKTRQIDQSAWAWRYRICAHAERLQLKQGLGSQLYQSSCTGI